jgi:hypothetical protein
MQQLYLTSSAVEIPTQLVQQKPPVKSREFFEFTGGFHIIFDLSANFYWKLRLLR